MKVIAATLATLAIALFASPAQACFPGEPTTYSFYTTDSGVPAPSSIAPAGYAFQDNTDFEDDNPQLCDSELLRAAVPSVTVYTCTA